MKKSTKESTTDNDESISGLVVSRFGNQAELEDAKGQVYRCHIKRSLQDLVVGDRVVWSKQKNPDNKISGVITQIKERDSILKRHIRYEGLKPIAANLNRVYVVTAPEPIFSNRILDRYLIAIELAHLEAVIIVNKTDRLEDYPELMNQLKIYTTIGYQVLPLSVKLNDGMDELKQSLAGHTSVLVGQSGVGKSSIINNLMPDEETPVASLSETSGLGTHTTTVSKLYHLPQQGHLIDSPGIREFTLGHVDKSEMAYGFREFVPFIGQCKFRNCTHRTEPGCAIITASKTDKISQERLQSYHQLYAESDELS